MPRIPFKDLDDVAEEDRDLVHSRGGAPVNLRLVMINHPRMLRAVGGIGKWFRREGDLDPRLRELAILEVGRVTGTAYEFSHHLEISGESGVSDEDVARLVASEDGDPVGLGELESHVVRLARQLTCDVDIDDSTWAAVRAAMSTEAAMELVGVVAYYNYVIRIVRGFQIDVEPQFAKLLDGISPAHGEWK